jgi:hypothetical protein
MLIKYVIWVIVVSIPIAGRQWDRIEVCMHMVGMYLLFSNSKKELFWLRLLTYLANMILNVIKLSDPL